MAYGRVMVLPSTPALLLSCSPVPQYSVLSTSVLLYSHSYTAILQHSSADLLTSRIHACPLFLGSWFPASRVPGFPGSRVSGLHFSVVLGFCCSFSPGSWVSVAPLCLSDPPLSVPLSVFLVSRLPGFRVSRFSGFPVSQVPRFPGLPGFIPVWQRQWGFCV
jgi:hypothetical protein